MPPHAKGNAGSGNELFFASFEKIVVWPLLVDFGYFSNYIWLQAAQEPTNPGVRTSVWANKRKMYHKHESTITYLFELFTIYRGEPAMS
jgi:hypothetical protein